MKRVATSGLLGTLLALSAATADEVGDDLAKVRSAATDAGVSDDAQQAWRRLATRDASDLPAILAGMNDAGPLGQNWVRTAVDAIAERQLHSGAPLPVDALEAFATDRTQSPRARRTAFEWLVRVDPDAQRRLLDGMLDDPSLSLRLDAVAQLLDRADALGEEQADEKRGLYESALGFARDPGQLRAIAETVGELGGDVDLPGLMGFLKHWRVIGPFDNAGLEHFDTAYLPEADQDPTQKHDGKNGEVDWKDATASTEDGNIDFIEPLGKEKEAVAYAFATFHATARAAELRYESRNATKVWLNGELVASNEVYHSGGGFDQYRATVQLKEGENTVLVKACQNEQRMPWEREWGFRLRVVDEFGTPVVEQKQSLAAN